MEPYRNVTTTTSIAVEAKDTHAAESIASRGGRLDSRLAFIHAFCPEPPRDHKQRGRTTPDMAAAVETDGEGETAQMYERGADYDVY
jgi:hypothetical protein